MAMGWRPFRRREADPEQVRRQELEDSLRHTGVLIAQAYAGFNAADDAELVESFVYEIQALQTRYSYLLRQRKALEPALPAQGRQALPVA